MKLQQGRFRLVIRKRFFTGCEVGGEVVLHWEWVVGHWNRLLREVVTAPSLLEFKKHLDNAVRNSLIFGWSCVELDNTVLVGHFQLGIFYDSIVL